MQTKTASLLQTAGVKPTRARVALMRVLLDAEAPLTHESIIQRLAITRVNRVTVYRALQALVDAGLAQRIEVGDRTWRFSACDPLDSAKGHPHFFCRLCGRMECLRSIPSPEIGAAPPGCLVEAQEVVLRGLCAQCAANANESITKKGQTA